MIFKLEIHDFQVGNFEKSKKATCFLQFARNFKDGNAKFKDGNVPRGCRFQRWKCPAWVTISKMGM